MELLPNRPTFVFWIQEDFVAVDYFPPMKYMLHERWLTNMFLQATFYVNAYINSKVCCIEIFGL